MACVAFASFIRKFAAVRLAAKGAFATAVAFAPVVAFADGATAGGEIQDAPPLVVVELFTSQSCFSCPPAEKLLARRYLNRADVLALELHVDYWDDLSYGFAGKWKDLWSDPAYTARQRDYNMSLRATPSVYTPQAVIHGAYYAGGANAAAIDRAIDDVGKVAAARAFAVRFSRSAAGQPWLAQVRPLAAAADIGKMDVRAVVFTKRAETQIGGGENKGKKLKNHNIVTALSRPEPAAASPAASRPPSGDGQADDGSRVFQMPRIDEATESCALIVQNPNSGVIAAAARCPSV